MRRSEPNNIFPGDDVKNDGGPHVSGGSAKGQDAESHEERIQRLFLEHNRSLLRFLMTRLRSEQEARDIAQEAYVRLLALDDPDTVSYLRAFLFRTAANLANDRLKQRQRRHQLRELIFFPESDERSPESSEAAREELRAVRAAISQLPPKCRMAFILVRIRDLSFEEAAKRMDLSTRMVRIYVARALAFCQERVALARVGN